MKNLFDIIIEDRESYRGEQGIHYIARPLSLDSMGGSGPCWSGGIGEGFRLAMGSNRMDPGVLGCLGGKGRQTLERPFQVGGQECSGGRTECIRGVEDR